MLAPKSINYIIMFNFQIHSKDVNKFQQAYWNLLKTNINGLRKLKKVKSAKPKAH